jgi:hypothetical protein
MKPFGQLEQAILNTITYGDIFQYPLTAGEIYRYLVGIPTTLQTIQCTLQTSDQLAEQIDHNGPFYFLPGREEIVLTRFRRTDVATGLWPKAIHYGRLISQIPFVRMVAVTGSLAMSNAEPGADIDYLIVTQAGRLWLARGLVVLLVRLAEQRGDRICPNYFLSDRALTLDDRNIYSAHELAQMVPLSGRSVYSAIRAENPWVQKYLPNAGGEPNVPIQSEDPHSPIQAIGERILQSPVGEFLERWEMRRKLHKFQHLTEGFPEACFGTDWCKGHADGHEEQTLSLYHERLQSLERISV